MQHPAEFGATESLLTEAKQKVAVRDDRRTHCKRSITHPRVDEYEKKHVEWGYTILCYPCGSSYVASPEEFMHRVIKENKKRSIAAIKWMHAAM